MLLTVGVLRLYSESRAEGTGSWCRRGVAQFQVGAVRSQCWLSNASRKGLVVLLVDSGRSSRIKLEPGLSASVGPDLSDLSCQSDASDPGAPSVEYIFDSERASASSRFQLS